MFGSALICLILSRISSVEVQQTWPGVFPIEEKRILLLPEREDLGMTFMG